MKILLIFSLLFVSVMSAQAATFTVTRTDDRNTTCTSGADCSLREAIGAAVGHLPAIRSIYVGRQNDNVD